MTKKEGGRVKYMFVEKDTNQDSNIKRVKNKETKKYSVIQVCEERRKLRMKYKIR